MTTAKLKRIALDVVKHKFTYAIDKTDMFNVTLNNSTVSSRELAFIESTINHIIANMKTSLELYELQVQKLEENEE